MLRNDRRRPANFRRTHSRQDARRVRKSFSEKSFWKSRQWKNRSARCKKAVDKLQLQKYLGLSADF
jgi:hypothetical protein